MMPEKVGQQKSGRIHHFVCDECDRTWSEQGYKVTYMSDCGDNISQVYEPPKADWCYACCDKPKNRAKGISVKRREVTEEELKAFQEAAKLRRAKEDLHDS